MVVIYAMFLKAIGAFSGVGEDHTWFRRSVPESGIVLVELQFKCSKK